MKAAHTVLYMKKHTQTYTSYPVMDISCMTGPPSRGGDLELEGGVNACHVEYVYESRDSHMRGTEKWRRRDKLIACLYW